MYDKWAFLPRNGRLTCGCDGGGDGNYLKQSVGRNKAKLWKTPSNSEAEIMVIPEIAQWHRDWRYAKNICDEMCSWPQSKPRAFYHAKEEHGTCGRALEDLKLCLLIPKAWYAEKVQHYSWRFERWMKLQHKSYISPLRVEQKLLILHNTGLKIKKENRSGELLFRYQWVENVSQALTIKSPDSVPWSESD